MDERSHFVSKVEIFRNTKEVDEEVARWTREIFDIILQKGLLITHRIYIIYMREKHGLLPDTSHVRITFPRYLFFSSPEILQDAPREIRSSSGSPRNPLDSRRPIRLPPSTPCRLLGNKPAVQTVFALAPLAYRNNMD